MLHSIDSQHIHHVYDFRLILSGFFTKLDLSSTITRYSITDTIVLCGMVVYMYKVVKLSVLMLLQ
jgi:hypothetical protein